MTIDSLPDTVTQVAAKAAALSAEPPRDPGALLSVAEAAVYINASLNSVYVLVRHRKIPHIKVPSASGNDPTRFRVRFRRADLDAWLDLHRVEMS